MSPAISVLFFFFLLGGRGAAKGVVEGGEGGLKHNGMDGIVKIMFDFSLMARMEMDWNC